MLLIQNIIIFSFTLVILSLLGFNIISGSIISITADSSNSTTFQQNSNNNNASNTAVQV